jgi:hypothetical protein
MSASRPMETIKQLVTFGDELARARHLTIRHYETVRMIATSASASDMLHDAPDAFARLGASGRYLIDLIDLAIRASD